MTCRTSRNLRGRRIAYVAALLPLLGIAAAAEDPPVRVPRISRTPEFVGLVRAARVRGVEWLQHVQADDGSYTEFKDFDGATTALAYQAMRTCGVPDDDPSAVKAWGALRRLYKANGLQNYTAAVYLMAIAEHGARAGIPPLDRVALSPADAEWAAEIAGRLVGAQCKCGGWNYAAEPDDATTDDHSNLQFALLGLSCAARCGVAVPPAVWDRALRHLLEQQGEKGRPVVRHDGAADAGGRKSKRVPVKDAARGWSCRDRSYGASWDSMGMTAGGVSSVMICRRELLAASALPEELDARSQRAAWDGIAYLADKWSLYPVERRPDYHGLYAVERAGVHAAVEWFGDVDWYGTGAQRLAAVQSSDGSWSGDEFVMRPEASETARRIVATAQALTFLQKATPPLDRGAITPGEDHEELNFAAAAKASDRDLEDFLDLVLSRWSRTTDRESKKRLFDGATSIGPRIVEPLVRRLGAREAAPRDAATGVLVVR